jgi:hypothetical protein
MILSNYPLRIALQPAIFVLDRHTTWLYDLENVSILEWRMARLTLLAFHLYRKRVHIIRIAYPASIQIYQTDTIDAPPYNGNYKDGAQDACMIPFCFWPWGGCYLNLCFRSSTAAGI